MSLEIVAVGHVWHSLGLQTALHYESGFLLAEQYVRGLKNDAHDFATQLSATHLRCLILWLYQEYGGRRQV